MAAEASATPQEWMDDLALMRHFVKWTTKEPFGAREEVQYLWQEVVTDMALEYPFLMHGVLSLASLHLVHVKPEEADKYLRICDRHQTRAVEMFRGLLSSEIVAQNATPMFALSSCISIASMSRQCATAAIQPEPQFVDIDQVCEMFLLTRGVADVVSACHESISKGPLAAMMTGYLLPADEDPLALPTTVTQRLEDLYHLAEKACPEEDKFDACKHALLQLDKTYQAIAYYDARNELQTGHAWSWMTSIPFLFVLMIQAREPVALIILADFAAASMSIESAWYTQKWGSYCLQGISMTLKDVEAGDWLEWPRRHAQSNMSVLRQSKTPVNAAP